MIMKVDHLKEVWTSKTGIKAFESVDGKRVALFAEEGNGDWFKLTFWESCDGKTPAQTAKDLLARI